MIYQPSLGAWPDADSVHFRVWAPDATTLAVVLDDRELDLAADERGYWSGQIPGIGVGTRYRYSIDHGAPLPDPASRSQPEGVHGPAEVIDPSAFEWHDQA